MELTLILFICAAVYALVAVGCYHAGVMAGKETLLDAFERLDAGEDIGDE